MPTAIYLGIERDLGRNRFGNRGKKGRKGEAPARLNILPKLALMGYRDI
jgi:hypothetical protein